MTLNHSTFYDLYGSVRTVICFLEEHGLDLFSRQDLLAASNADSRYLKVFVNCPGRGIVAHRPLCPDRPHLISGFGDACETGFLFGMLDKAQLMTRFGDLENFVDLLGERFNFRNNMGCPRCGVKEL